jgi:hypothetical protein
MLARFRKHRIAAVSVYVLAILVITMACVLAAPETSKIDLHAEPPPDRQRAEAGRA